MFSLLLTSEPCIFHSLSHSSVQTKGRLKFCIVMHHFMFALMLVKLADDILDRMDIFILQLQELYVPKPALWEWIWSASLIFTWTGWKAIRKNSVVLMKVYSTLIFLSSICPLLYALYSFSSDFWVFFNERSVENVNLVWQGYPIALIWYLFGIVCLQVHLFEVYFAYILIRSWTTRKSRTE